MLTLLFVRVEVTSHKVVPRISEFKEEEEAAAQATAAAKDTMEE
jgi:hypothetical protein